MYIQSGELVTILKDKMKTGFHNLVHNKYFSSMRFRILVFSFVITLIPLIIFGFWISNMAQESLVEQRVEKIKNQTTALRNHLVEEGFSGKELNSQSMLEVDTVAGLYGSRIQIVSNGFRVLKDTYLVDKGKVNISLGVLTAFQGKDTCEYDKKSHTISCNTAITIGNSSQTVGVISVIAPTNDIYAIIQGFQSKMVLIEILIMVAVISVVLFISNALVKPLKKIGDSIEKYSEGDFKEPIKVKGCYETEQITEAFNHMVDRFNEIDESRTQFVSNVSHELKTPITSVKVLADSLLSQENVPAEMYREFLQDIVTEVDRENEIVTDLLTLVRLDKQTDALKIEPANINEMVEQVIKRLRPIAEQKNIELVFESFRPVIADVDPIKLGMVINNLVENAIKYNILDGWVHVSLNADHKYFFLKVADSGIGIDEEEQDKIFERFYRVDKARARDGDAPGGTGLGLAITKSIVLMHRGAIKVYSKEGEGTTFSVRIPLKYIVTGK